MGSGSECVLRAACRLINRCIVKIYIHVIMGCLNVCTYEVWMRQHASEFDMSEFAGSQACDSDKAISSPCLSPFCIHVHC